MAECPLTQDQLSPLIQCISENQEELNPWIESVMKSIVISFDDENDSSDDEEEDVSIVPAGLLRYACQTVPESIFINYIVLISCDLS